MKSNADKLNEILKSQNLRCYMSDCNGDKKITFIGIEGSGFDFNLSLTWHGEVIFNEFRGTIGISEFCKMMQLLETEIIKLQL